MHKNATLYVCTTCDRARASTAPDGLCGGEKLLQHLKDLAPESLDLRTTACLMACDNHCTIHMRSPRRINYVAGRFSAEATSALDIITFFNLYQNSETGQVPYKQWPQGIKGHFISRTPPFED
jgi:predicted metal-binding protein